MPQACSVCNHPKRLEIDKAILSGRSLASISRQYGVSSDALYHHRDNHITRQLATAMAKKELYQSMDMLSEIDELLHRTRRIMAQAEAKNNPNLELKAIAEARGSYELLSKIALTLHQIRIAELQTEQFQQQKKEYANLSIFNTRELLMFRKLLRKLNEGDASIEVLKDNTPSITSVFADDTNIPKDADARHQVDLPTKVIRTKKKVNPLSIKENI
jgi:transposase-like protein